MKGNLRFEVDIITRRGENDFSFEFWHWRWSSSSVWYCIDQLVICTSNQIWIRTKVMLNSNKVMLDSKQIKTKSLHSVDRDHQSPDGLNSASKSPMMRRKEERVFQLTNQKPASLTKIGLWNYSPTVCLAIANWGWRSEFLGRIIEISLLVSVNKNW